ncbi:S8/S53 family peptidase [Dyadobacter diqingensis]|uniref:S8/S53 family peptidase n=1 Tax=Dyadobacter diqingensis TaxID=2938121 RepID=UPI0020C38AF2|nr:S8/S53 family peptidase [Dyadobacter diqingensis]
MEFNESIPRTQDKKKQGDKKEEECFKPVKDNIPDFVAGETPYFEKYGVYAVTKQKILVISAGEKSTGLLLENNYVTLIFSSLKPVLSQPFPIRVRVVRVSECANPDNEYLGGLTYTVLIEWTDNYEFGVFEKKYNPGILVQSQCDNLILSGNPPNTDPGSIKALKPDGAKILPSNFLGHDAKDTSLVAQSEIVVAVVDTGLAYKQQKQDTNINASYIDSNGRDRHFQIADIWPFPSHGDRLAGNKIGYCSVTPYLRACSNDNQDAKYRNNPNYQALKNLSRNVILNTPYDDNRYRVDSKDKGKHGSLISAIINQKGCAPVLPVKSFDFAGTGTLFDLLCALNYVLACKKAGMPVKIINLSFEGRINPDGFKLLKKKFKSLWKNKIWVVAAAGNEGKELKFDHFLTGALPGGNEIYNIFPACFSGIFNNVITVTDVSKTLTLHKEEDEQSGAFLTDALENEIRSEINNRVNLEGLFWHFKYHFNGNYSSSFVNAAVISPYGSPSNGDLLHGTSFAAAYFSASLAKYLRTNYAVPGNTPWDWDARQDVIDKITHPDLMLRNLVRNNALLDE